MDEPKEEKPARENIFRVLWECLCDFTLAPLGAYIESEWSTVKKAPAILFVCVLLAGTLGGFLNGWTIGASKDAAVTSSGETIVTLKGFRTRSEIREDRT